MYIEAYSMTEQEFKELLDKFLDGKTTGEEERLLSEFEENAMGECNDHAFASDIEKARTKKEIFSKLKKKTRKKQLSWIGIAASILLLIGMGATFLLIQNDAEEPLIVSNTSDTGKRIVLEDGSTAILNQGSKIRYDNDFDGIRYAVLDGEAFFEVARDEKKPFIVKAGVTRTRVLGTSFNISESGTEVNVTVATGLVEVSDETGSVTLRPDQRTTYHIKSKLFDTSDINHNLFTFWYKNSVKLEGISMLELADFIRYKYGSEVGFVDGEARKNRMTISLRPQEGIQTLMDNINYIGELKLTKNGNDMIEVRLR